MKRGQGVAIGAVLLAGAAYFPLCVLLPRSEQGIGVIAYDTYAYFYPNILHAWQSLREGAGLLWNPYQNCGQPFFALSVTGLLYPVNVVFFFLSREPALLASLVLNLAIGSAGAWLLCRELALTRSACLCGALAFELGGTALTLGAWSPMHVAPYVWMPWAMFVVERLLRSPTPRVGIALGAVLALQLLPGFPQTCLFTYQLVALRVAWALLSRTVPRTRRIFLPLALGLVSAPLLAAVQYAPALEVASQSLRSAPLTAAETGPAPDWEALRVKLQKPFLYPGNAITMLVLVLGLAGLGNRAIRGRTLFFLAVGVTYLVLSLGSATPLFDLYAHLPFGRAFREPPRFLWVTGFALAILTALGAEAIIRLAAVDRFASRLVVPIVSTAGGAAFFFIVGPRSSSELHLAVLLLAISLGAAVWQRGAKLGQWVLPPMVLVNCLFWPVDPFLNLRAGDLYMRHAEVFRWLGSQLTPQQRIHVISPGPSWDRLARAEFFSLIPKSASIFRLAAVADYEPQTSRRYAEFSVREETNRPMRSINDYYYRPWGWMPVSLNWKLLHLTAARYLVLSSEASAPALDRNRMLKVVHQAKGVTVYEDPQALPRAFFVPGIRVVQDDLVLEALSDPRHDPRSVALVTHEPASGFHGSVLGGRAEVGFIEDKAEEVVLDVRAENRGFLFLADEYFPGWRATVNGKRVEILRANHTFRLVEIPRGASRVIFRFVPISLYAGVLVSLLTALVLAYLYRRFGAERPEADASQELLTANWLDGGLGRDDSF